MRNAFLTLLVALLIPLGAAAVAQDIAAMEQHMAKIAEQARQSVVRVTAERSWPGAADSPLFTTSYSGVVWDSEGRIMTAAEAVIGAKTVKIETIDGKTFDAKVLGADDQTNAAVVQVDTKDLHPATIGKSADVKVGHWVLAIGNPFGLSGSVSLGIVSGVNRRIERDGRPVWNMIQITAPINPGDSGGAVVNSRGELVGIVHSTYGRAPSVEGLWAGSSVLNGHMAQSAIAAEGINFVMPVDTIKPVAVQLVKHGEVRRGWLGVGIQTIAADTPDEDREGQKEGVIVTRVLAQSPAIEAGLEPGDVLISYDGKKVLDAGQLIQMVGNTEPAQKVEIKGIRDGKPMSFAVTIGRAPKPEDDYQKIMGDLLPFFSKGWLGVRVEDLSPEMSKSLNIPHGAMVVSVVPGSPAQEMGLLNGDVIIRFNKEDIHGAHELRQAVISRRPSDVAGGVFELEVVRKGERVSISSKP